MSKYNLTDILEQYKIGSGWTSDFDYDGMLNVGLKTSIDTPIEVLKKMSDDFEDVNYHRENSHLQDAIDAIEIGDMMEAEGRLNDFHIEIRKTQEDQGMDIEPTLGKFMDAKMDMMNEDEFDEARQAAIESSQEAAGITEGRYASIDREVADRIEGFLNIPMKKKLLDAWEDLFYDLVDDEPFDMEDVLAHLSNEMGKVIDGNQMAGDKLAGIEQEEFTAIPEEDSMEEVMGVDRKGNKKPDTDGSDATKFKKAAMSEEEMSDDEKRYTDAAAKMIKDRILKDIPMDIIVDFVKTHGSDIRRMNNSEIKDEFEEFRSVNYDYIDEDLKQHFKRFK